MKRIDSSPFSGAHSVATAVATVATEGVSTDWAADSCKSAGWDRDVLGDGSWDSLVDGLVGFLSDLSWDSIGDFPCDSGVDLSWDLVNDSPCSLFGDLSWDLVDNGSGNVSCGGHWGPDDFLI